MTKSNLLKLITSFKIHPALQKKSFTLPKPSDQKLLCSTFLNLHLQYCVFLNLISFALYSYNRYREFQLPKYKDENYRKNTKISYSFKAKKVSISIRNENGNYTSFILSRPDVP